MIGWRRSVSARFAVHPRLGVLGELTVERRPIGQSQVGLNQLHRVGAARSLPWRNDPPREDV